MTVSDGKPSSSDADGSAVGASDDDVDDASSAGDPSGMPSSPQTRRSCIRHGTATLRRAGRDAPRRTAIWLLCDIAGLSRASVYGYPEEPVDPDVVDDFTEAVRRRADGEPLQHILGYDEFFGLRLRVSPDVLVPRPETEEVVEYALKAMRSVDSPRVLDAGTGSGCIALALKSERPDAQVMACDVSEAALDVARANASRLTLDVDFRRADMLTDDFAARCQGPFDLLISNPPYIPEGEAETLSDTVREYDPHLALFSGEDALRFYRVLARHARGMLAPGGRLIVETHAHYASGVADVFGDAGLTNIQVEQDLAGRPRIAMAMKPVAD